MANVDYSAQFTIQDLIDLRVHFGHKVGALNPKMRDYVFGTKNGISIIDVRKTYTSAIRAMDYCYKCGKTNKKILFVGTAPQIAPIVKEYAEKCGQFYVTDRWLGGILTNWYTVSKSIKTLISHNKALEDPESNLTKKEIVTLTKKRDKLMASFGGLMNLRGHPDLVIVLNTKVDLDNITYPIASNDESSAIARFFCNEFAKAILAGSQENTKEAGLDMAKALKIKTTKEKEEEKSEKKNNDGTGDRQEQTNTDAE